MNQQNVNTLDFSSCDREQVHSVGSIMPHGVLLVLERTSWGIRAVSNNSQSLLALTPDALMASQLDSILDAKALEHLNRVLTQITSPAPPHYLGCFAIKTNQAHFDAFVHLSGDVFLLELEVSQTSQFNDHDRLHEVYNSVLTLQQAVDFNKVTAIAAEELKRLSGYDSVIAVRFLDDGSGHAIAEARTADFPSFLDKRFPASDVPEPGRRQMRMTKQHYAPDLSYEPVALNMRDISQPAASLDLSYAMLRSISAMCSRYYLNMGARSRLLLPLVINNTLWGFFCCLNSSAKSIAYLDRLACQSFAGMTLQLLLEMEKSEQNQKAYALNLETNSIITELSLVSSFTHVLSHLPSQLLACFDLSGIAISIDNRIITAGLTPNKSLLKSLLNWLDQKNQDTFASDRFPSVWSNNEDNFDHITGLLAVRLMNSGEYLLGFRQEWLHEVRWAGDKDKPMVFDDSTGQFRLTPRGSFAEWKQTVRGQSKPWHDYEIKAMQKLQHALVLLQHSEKERALKLFLEQSNADLEAFAFIVAHDLKEPLRGISNLSKILQTTMRERIEQKEHSWIESIISLSERLALQTEALLQYSRAGQNKLEILQVNINDLLSTVLEKLAMRIAESNTQLNISLSLPTIACDQIRTVAIFENLICNAIKYNDNTEKLIEIGYSEDDNEYQFFVKDNGIGIAEEQQSKIFDIFQRLHGRNDYGGGTGAGLTITLKHIERQKGRIWLKSQPGEGSVFYFTLPKYLMAKNLLSDK